MNELDVHTPWHSELFAELRDCQTSNPSAGGDAGLAAILPACEHGDLRAALSMGAAGPIVSRLWDPLDAILDPGRLERFAVPELLDPGKPGVSVRTSFSTHVLDCLISAAAEVEQSRACVEHFKTLTEIHARLCEPGELPHWSGFLRGAMRPGAKYLVELAAMGYFLSVPPLTDRTLLLVRSEPLLHLIASLGAGPAKVLLSYTSRDDEKEIGLTDPTAFEIVSAASLGGPIIRIKESILRRAVRHAATVIEPWSLRFCCPALFAKRAGLTLIQFAFRRVAAVYNRASALP